MGHAHEAAAEKATADEAKNQELTKASAAFAAGLGKAAGGQYGSSSKRPEV